MSRQEVFEKLNEVFADVFDRNDILLNDETSSAEVQGWDSLVHITLISSIEDEFDMQFEMKDIISMKNVGEMVDLILAAIS